jgi:hypothetical protein
MYPSDYLATRSNHELVELLRDSRTLPIEHLINRGTVTVDYARQRIDRDSFWKGSFARGTLLGLDARLFTRERTAEPYFTGGAFWKRFDEIADNSATGFVVNYGLSAVYGLPRVRAIKYPDDSSPYVRAGDDVLLLEYANHPYRFVYDLLKIIDPNNCVGIFHLGRFPRGVRAGTFVLARNSYPFDKMSAPDHDAIFEGPEATVPTARQLGGTWSGTRVFVRRPETALANQFNPPLRRRSLVAGDHRELRMIGPDAVLGRRIARRDGGDRVTRRFFLRRERIV